MYIGIISAMKEEILALQEIFEVEEKIVKGMRSYYRGTLYGKKTVLVFSRWGKVASATTATQLINLFDIKEVIFTGVAGAIHPEVSVGDVIIGKDLFQHDLDASPLVKPHEVPLLGKRAFTTDKLIRARLKESCRMFLDTKDQYLSYTQLSEFNITTPKTHIADIASGDQFISSKDQITKILRGLPSVYCVEMEGASVAQVCFEYGIPFSIIRTISDNANHNAHVDFPKFAAEIASTYALGILKNYLES